jgi:hypothetical protein
LHNDIDVVGQSCAGASGDEASEVRAGGILEIRGAEIAAPVIDAVGATGLEFMVAYEATVFDD